VSSLNRQPPEASVIICFVHFVLQSYHPHHEVGEDSDPQGGGHEGDHEPAVPAWQDTIRHRAVEQEAQRPLDQPRHPRTAASCEEREVSQEGQGESRQQAFQGPLSTLLA